MREQQTSTKISLSVYIVASAQNEKVKRRSDWVREGWENTVTQGA